MRPPARLIPMSESASVPDLPDSAGPTVRVLVVAESFLPQVNGVTNSVRHVLQHLAACGHEAVLVAPTGPPSYAGFPILHTRGANLPFYRDFRIGLETRGRLRQVMERFRPDVVHIASPATLGYQAARVACELGLPSIAIYQTDLVGFARRYGVTGAPQAMARLTRSIHRQVDRTLAPSHASLRQLRALGVPRLFLWPRGVDAELFHPGQRQRTDTRLRVGYVGRLAPEKELDLLAHLTDLADVELVLVGGGPEEQRLRSVLPGAAYPGVLHGEELARASADLDVFVHTGRHETYCPSAQEALASGVPVVAPRAGGPVDVVPPEAGFLYEPGDGQALRRCVDALARDPDLRARMGEAAREAVLDRTWAKVNVVLVRHYREVVAERTTWLSVA